MAHMLLRLSRAGLLALGLATGTGLAHAQPPIRVQEAILRAKPAVVLVVAEVQADVALDCGTGPTTVRPLAFRETGTGWFVDPAGWIITNGHVVQPAHQPPAWLVNQLAQRAVSSACLPGALAAAGLTPGQRPDAEEAIKRRLLDRVLPGARVKLQPTISVLVSSGSRLAAEVKKYSPPVSNVPGAMSGQDFALLKVPGNGAYPALLLADSRAAQIGDPIHVLGFPGVVLSHELLNESASLEASVTNGAVSGFKEDVANQPVIQTDAPAAWGNSGGPAVNQRGQVLGVLTFVSLAPGADGGIVQGFNFVIPSQAVRDFVRGTPVDLAAPSRFNQHWFKGLEAFFGEDWREAREEFRKVEALMPGLPDVKRILVETEDRIKNPPPRPFPWFWVAVAVTLVSGGGYGAQLALRWHRNRYRVTPSEVIRLLESHKAPIILDARKPEAFDRLPLKIPGSMRVTPEEIASGLSGLDLDLSRSVVAYCT